MSAESTDRNFVDTNLLVYAYDRSAGDKQAICSRLVEECWENESGCVSMQVLQEFFVTVTRKIAKPLDILTARQIVADLAQWHLHFPDVSDLLQTIDFQQNFQLSFWDAMIVQSAVNMGCKILLSEDLNHGQLYGGVQVINPFREIS
jgi:predicted nucleic acid-binding protein